MPVLTRSEPAASKDLPSTFIWVLLCYLQVLLNSLFRNAAFWYPAHINTSKFNEINADLQSQASKITVISGRTFYQPHQCQSPPAVRSISFALFIFFRHILLLISAQNSVYWDFQMRSRAWPQSWQTTCPGFQQTATCRHSSQERMPTGRGSLCQGHWVGLALEQHLIYNNFRNAKHSSLAVLVHLVPIVIANFSELLVVPS